MLVEGCERKEGEKEEGDRVDMRFVRPGSLFVLALVARATRGKVPCDADPLYAFCDVFDNDSTTGYCGSTELTYNQIPRT